MKNFFDRWCIFFKVVIDPWFIISAIFTVYFSITINTSKETNITTLLTVLISLFSGVAGSILAKNIISINGEDALRARGKVSIRSLKLILGNLYSFGKRLSTQNDNKQSLYSIQDIYERITILEEEVLSSIENWTDIIPEADMKTQIGIITELQKKLEEKEKEKNEIISELTNKTNKTIAEKEQLVAKLNDIVYGVKQAELELNNKASYLLGSSLSIIKSANTENEVYNQFQKELRNQKRKTSAQINSMNFKNWNKEEK